MKEIKKCTLMEIYLGKHKLQRFERGDLHPRDNNIYIYTFVCSTLFTSFAQAIIHCLHFFLKCLKKMEGFPAFIKRAKLISIEMTR